jgi:Cu+-exporting ATPase
MGKLTPDEFVAVKLLTSYSTHPLSNLVNRSIAQKAHGYASYFTEQPGKGIEGIINGKQYRVGSGTFVGAKNTRPTNTAVFVAIDDDVKGYFLLKTSIRTQIRAMLSRLGQQCAAMISGDNDSDIDTMRKTFPTTTSLLFNQQPGDKMEYIAGLQRDGKKVLMVGDGLNDAGALKQADVGVAVTDDAGLFTPGCDGILAGNELHRLDKFLLLARKSTTILKAAFAISFIYNAIALTFAVTGNLTPLVAAILMPISSISVVGFSTIAVNASVKKML